MSKVAIITTDQRFANALRKDTIAGLPNMESSFKSKPDHSVYVFARRGRCLRQLRHRLQNQRHRGCVFYSQFGAIKGLTVAQVVEIFFTMD